MAKLLGVYAVAGAAQFPIAWLLMLIVGIVHADWLPALPTVGYWTTLLLCALLFGMRFLQVAAVSTVKTIGGGDKAAIPKTVTMQRVSPAPDSMLRGTRWVDPAKFNRDLL